MPGKKAEARSGHNDFVARESPSRTNFFIAIGDFGAYIYVTLESHTNVDYHREQKKLLRRAFVTEKVEIVPSI